MAPSGPERGSAESCPSEDPRVRHLTMRFQRFHDKALPRLVSFSLGGVTARMTASLESLLAELEHFGEENAEATNRARSENAQYHSRHGKVFVGAGAGHMRSQDA